MSSSANSRFSSLGSRLAVAAAGIPLMALIAWLGGWWLFVLVLFISLIGYSEFMKISGGHLKDLIWIWGFVGVCLVLLYFQMPTLSPVFFFIWLLSLLVLSLLIVDPFGLRSLAFSLLGLAYIPMLLGHILLIRNLTAKQNIISMIFGRGDGRLGFWILLWAMALVWIYDTGAYFSGLLWGRLKLAPGTSPNKSIEGLVGGLLVVVPAAIILAWWWRLPWSLWHSAILSLLIVIFGTLGDLVESKFKRLAGIKDSGTLLLGHGGVLDRFDSMMFALPAVYWYIRIVSSIG